ncbi:ACP S-malonyltransferase [Streptomyces sp. NPDC039022]|uniref:ACP S-malonyltransferase n=1 Tax=Streptomyces sp. NPDC039022 TaxID=3157091 RepID=UPI003411E4C5
MNRIAFVFPGQGSQTTGMGHDVVREFPAIARTYFDTADEVLGFPLSRLCFDGSAEDLRDTSVTQPGIFVTSLAIQAVLHERGVRPEVVAGHSLGEYAALVCSGVLEWTDALRLVRERGRLMEGVNRRTPGKMAAVVGLAAARVEELCEQVSRAATCTVEVANYNTPSQTVVSGSLAGVDALSHAALGAGAAHVVPLNVGAPFHSSLMRDIEEEFGSHLEAVRFGTPRIPVVANVTARYVESGAEARELLRRQLTSPVRWYQSLELLVKDEAAAFIEAGPGRVLTNIGKTAAPGIPVLAAGTVRQLSKAVERLLPVPS